MGKKDRKQRKKKERQERIRREKHLRHYGPGDLDVGPLDEEEDFEDEWEGLDLPPSTATERMFRGLGGVSSWFRGFRNLLPGGRAGGNAERAQELAYDAMEAADPQQAAKLARQALALDPDCTDALYTLALKAAPSPQERLQLLEQAVAAGERNLGGPAYFEQNRGSFWGLVETRPYMRARSALADVLRGEERMDEAIGHYEALLDLNPNDNQGIRGVLIGCYFQVGNLEGVRRLLERYDEDWSVEFAYARVLERFLAGDREGAARERRKARERNPHVEAYLTGRKRLPRRMPEYYSPGDENEAIQCALYLTEAWLQHPEAMAWLANPHW